MYVDLGKKIVDIGEIGNASTGDILYDGGKKINDNFDAIYNAFADQRLFAAGSGANNQKIHATSYYQKVTWRDLSNPVPSGACLDVDTSAGAANVRLPKGKRGEGVYIINTNGTLATGLELKISTSGEGSVDTFKTGGRDLFIITPFCRVELWCIEVKANGSAVWDYSVSSLFGNRYMPIEATYSITSSPKVIRIAGRDEYSSIKLMLSFVATPGGSTPVKRHSSEVLLMIDPTEGSGKVYDTEYAVLRNGEATENEKMFEIAYTIDTTSKAVIATVSTKYGNARLAIKTTATQTIGVGQ